MPKRSEAPRRSSIPTPEEWFGHPVGAARRLIRWPRMVDYLQTLAAKSDRLRYDELGGVWNDQALALLTISAPENLQQLDELQAIQQTLADPRTITSASHRQQLLVDGRCICLITCSIHPTEVGATQMTPELVYELVTRNDDQVRSILAQCVILLVPSLNPGGLELVADWYERTLDTRSEGTPPPELYHPYAGHDNNRDWFMLTQPETRLLVTKVHNRWRPHIVFDLHQMQANGPRYVVPPFTDPYDENVDPLLQAQVNALGQTIATELTAQGKRGVATSIIFDAFSPSRAYCHYHGGVRILAEAASARLATPVEIPPDQLAETRGFQPNLRAANHPCPWEGGNWSLRDIIDYNKIAVYALLDHAARYRDRWLRNFLLVQERGIGIEQPHAFLIPPDEMQRDPSTTRELVSLLHDGDVEIEALTEAAEADGVTHPRGTRVIRTAQPFGRYAKTLLEIQHYPVSRLYPGGPPKPPYDITAHTLPLMMGVDVIQVDEPLHAKTRRVEKGEPLSGGISGRPDANHFLVDSASNAAFRLINLLLQAGARIERTAESDLIDGRLLPAGTFIVTDVDRATIDEVGKHVDVMVDAVEGPIRPATLTLRLPRVGVYRSWKPNAIDEGWTRFVLENYNFPYTSVRDDIVRAGNLARAFDVIVLPQQPARDIINGNSNEEYPEPFAGGIGDDGVRQLGQFVEEGGSLVALDSAGEVAIRALNLPVVNCLESVQTDLFSCPGAILRLLLDINHPVAWGFEREVAAMFVASPVYEPLPRREAEITVIGRYPVADQLLSGWMLGAEKIAGKAAIVEASVGQGRVILIGCRPQFRAQARGTYRLLFNALYASTMVR